MPPLLSSRTRCRSWSGLIRHSRVETCPAPPCTGLSRNSSRRLHSPSGPAPAASGIRDIRACAGIRPPQASPGSGLAEPVHDARPGLGSQGHVEPEYGPGLSGSNLDQVAYLMHYPQPVAAGCVCWRMPLAGERIFDVTAISNLTDDFAAVSPHPER